VLKLGEKQILSVVKEVDFGVYLGDEDEQVLLPKKQVPADIKIGDEIEVFLYKDSMDRLIATTNNPLVMVGGTALLRVAQTGKNGAFLYWGFEKDLFLPFKEQTYKVQEDDQVIVTLYIDKSQRICSTMKVYQYLETNSPYKKGDIVEGRIYDKSDNFGLFVAVDNKYSALIPKHEMVKGLRLGMVIEGRITNIKEDGKIDISLRAEIPQQMSEDAAAILEVLKEYNGILPVTEKSSPEQIKEELSMSKAAFKRAVGKLLKEGEILIVEDVIKKI
jgi:predicted RNA-binding protein (virulence factor B family)